MNKPNKDDEMSKHIDTNELMRMLISRDILTDDDRKYVWQDQRHEILKLSVISCRYQWSDEDADIKRYIDWWWQEICMTGSKTWNNKIFCDITVWMWEK